MLAIPPFWASSKNALLRANTKPPVELVVADLDLSEKNDDPEICFWVISFTLWWGGFFLNISTSHVNILFVIWWLPLFNEGSK